MKVWPLSDTIDHFLVRVGGEAPPQGIGIAKSSHLCEACGRLANLLRAADGFLGCRFQVLANPSILLQARWPCPAFAARICFIFAGWGGGLS